MTNAGAIAAVLAIMGVLAISTACWAIHPMLGILVLGVFCLVGAAFAAKVAGLGE